MARLTMSDYKDVIRLRYKNNLSYRQISLSTGVAKSTISDYCIRFEITGLNVEEFLSLPETILEAKLFPERNILKRTNRPLPDFDYVASEIRKKGVTWLLLWQEYKEVHPDGYNYTQFKKYCNDHMKKLNPSMRQVYKAGETMFVDYSGLTMELADPVTGEIYPAQIFVASLGASGAVFAHATENQKQESFIYSHTLAFEYFGGVAGTLIPDNLKSAVISHKKNHVDLNDSYADMARYYGCAVVPTRVRHPQDKAKVEQAVQGIQRWILSKLRNRIFFSIQELNEVIVPLVQAYNNKAIKGIGRSRYELLVDIDRPALISLPLKRYQYRQYLQRMAHIDYHVDIEGSFYSVPYQFIKEKVDVWYSKSTVEIYHKGERIATHPRSYRKGYASTLEEHMPPNHKYHQERWNPGRIINWASSIGFNTARLMKAIMEHRNHPVQGYRSCIAILNLSKNFSKEELDKACGKACEIKAYTVKSVESILKNKLYIEKPEKDTDTLMKHENVRGKDYYEQQEEI